ncbi:cell separation during budding [Balamuthia mandrillaris]
MQTKSSAEQLLSSCLALSIPREKQNVLWVNSSDPASKVLSLMACHRVHGFPVWDDDAKLCIGMVSIHDLVALALEIADYVPAMDNHGRLQEEELQKQRSYWHAQRVKPIVDLSRKNEVVPLECNATAWDALVVLAQGVPRVPVLSQDLQRIDAIISQSLMVKFLYDNIDKFPQKAKRLVHQIIHLNEPGRPHVISVDEDATTIQAFRLIQNHGITAVAVVNAGGQIVGVISATDIELIGGDDWLNHLLFIPCKDFLTYVQQKNAMENLPPVIDCTPTKTLEGVMKLMVEHHVHRVFVVFTQRGRLKEELVGIVSMKEVLLEFLK